MVEQIPLAFVFGYAVVGGPTDYRLKNNTLKGERAIRIITYSITKQMTVARASSWLRRSGAVSLQAACYQFRRE